MSRVRISQREARRLQKLVAAMSQSISAQRRIWAKNTCMALR